MIENTKCYSATISSKFADHAGITIKISDKESRVLILDESSMKKDKGIFGCLYDEKTVFSALREGMTASVFINDSGNPMSANIVVISPNYC